MKTEYGISKNRRIFPKYSPKGFKISYPLSARYICHFVALANIFMLMIVLTQQFPKEMQKKHQYQKQDQSLQYEKNLFYMKWKAMNHDFYSQNQCFAFSLCHGQWCVFSFQQWRVMGISPSVSFIFFKEYDTHLIFLC